MAPPATRDLERGAAFLARALVIVTAAMLLTSIGGAAIYAAPATLPALLAICALSREGSWRNAAVIVAALTAFEKGRSAAEILWR